MKLKSNLASPLSFSFLSIKLPERCLGLFTVTGATTRALLTNGVIITVTESQTSRCCPITGKASPRVVTAAGLMLGPVCESPSTGRNMSRD